MNITKETLIGELLEEHPETEVVIREHLGDVGCLNCPGKYFDTLEAGAALHGMSPEQVETMVKAINKKINT